jgi:hypothetical protein
MSCATLGFSAMINVFVMDVFYQAKPTAQVPHGAGVQRDVNTIGLSRARARPLSQCNHRFR